MSTPQTTINIVSGVAIDSRYHHSIYFTTQGKQLDYFGGKVVKTLTAYSYCRKSWSLKVDAMMEDARKWNYLYFRNTATGKWWFYFINNVEYVNDNTVELTLELDVIQTYMFDWYLPPCHIERQHTPTDALGGNTVEEDLDTGELTTGWWFDLPDIEELCVLMLATYNPLYTSDKDNIDKVFASRYNGVFGGLGVWAGSMSDWQAMGAKLNILSDEGLIDGVVTMWMYPKALVKLGKYPDGVQATWTDGNVFKPVTSMEKVSTSIDADFSPLSSVGNYIPKNAKLYQYPFNFLYVSNNMGSGGVYRFERFSGDVIQGDQMTFSLGLQLYGGYSPEADVKMVLQGYDNMGYETAMEIGNFPTCAWNADAYKIWLAQNQNSLGLSNAMAGLSIAGGIATTAVSAYLGNPVGIAGGVGAVMSGGKTIADNLAMKQDREVQPPQARGNHSATTNIMAGKHTFTFYWRHVTAERARIIDHYFTQYGYAIKRVQYPNICARSLFTYIRTNGCVVGGQICNEDRIKIESIFDSGITFWRDGDSIGMYHLTNDPIGE